MLLYCIFVPEMEKIPTLNTAKVGIISLATGKCPRCGEGEIFESANPYNLGKMTNMHSRCPHCQLNFNPEVGFYWGATYVSYVLTVAFSGLTFAISTLLFGFMNSLSLRYVVVNGILITVLSPLFFRFSRIIWLWIFYER